MASLTPPVLTTHRGRRTDPPRAVCRVFAVESARLWARQRREAVYWRQRRMCRCCLTACTSLDEGI